MTAVTEQALRNTLPDRVRASMFAMGIRQGAGSYQDYERVKRVLVEWELTAAEYSTAIKTLADYLGV
jgi:hypothetical protein